MGAAAEQESLGEPQDTAAERLILLQQQRLETDTDEEDQLFDRGAEHYAAIGCRGGFRAWCQPAFVSHAYRWEPE